MSADGGAEGLGGVREVAREDWSFREKPVQFGYWEPGNPETLMSAWSWPEAWESSPPPGNSLEKGVGKPDRGELSSSGCPQTVYRTP